MYFVFAIEGDPPGLKAEDMQASVATMKSIAESLNLESVFLRDRMGPEGEIKEFLLRKKVEMEDFMEVR